MNPYERYTEQSVMTMTHGEMLIKLYEETIKQINIGKSSILSKNIVTANAALQKAQRILTYLKATLDFKYPISSNLADLYDFFIEQLVAANIRKETKLLDDILPLVEELKDAFTQGERIARMDSTNAQSYRVG
ncbi:MAG: flagellar export chaperone FliS [Hydrogenoanaerobacterium sp.]